MKMDNYLTSLHIENFPRKESYLSETDTDAKDDSDDIENDDNDINDDSDDTVNDDIDIDDNDEVDNNH